MIPNSCLTKKGPNNFKKELNIFFSDKKQKKIDEEVPQAIMITVRQSFVMYASQSSFNFSFLIWNHFFVCLLTFALFCLKGYLCNRTKIDSTTISRICLEISFYLLPHSAFCFQDNRGIAKFLLHFVLD